MSIAIHVYMNYNIDSSRGKGVVKMANKKRRRRKPTAQPKRLEVLADTILAGTVSGLIVLAIQKLLDW